MHLVLLLLAADPSAPFRTFVQEPAARALEDHLARTAVALHQKLSKVDTCDAKQVSSRLSQLVADNLEQKHTAGFLLDAARIRRQVIEAEAFKLETFVTAGVFPKRYFGYLDEQHDTAAYETRLKSAARKSARACNRWLENAHATFRVTEQELIVTFLAEGGAILLREKQDQLESIHPVQGIGLDDIATGFADLEPLVKQLDTEVGTNIAGIVKQRDGKPYLSRNFRFEEAIAGTAAMWVWEKQIAERKLRAAGRMSLGKRTLEDQFVIASLVYNSGILFEESTITKVRTFESGAYLFDLSEASKAKRWALPIAMPKLNLERQLSGGPWPDQPTSWSAVYHVLQRYGAYVGLSRFTDAFDAKGALR